jgi:hypothetical protein
MTETHVVFGLVERRARVAGDLPKMQLRAMALKADLSAIDSCLRMFKADYKPEDIEAKPTLEKNPASLPKGTGSRAALDVLRATGEALTAPELARRILISMNRETSDRAVDMLAKTIHRSFSRQRHRAVEYDRSTWPGKWRLLPREIAP